MPDSRVFVSKVRRAPKGLIGLAKNHGGYFLTTIVNSSLPILFLPILTRYLSPAEYAHIALFNFLFLLSNSLTGTSIPIVISKNFFSSEKPTVAKIIGNAMRIVVVLSAGLTLLILAFSSGIRKFLDLPVFWLAVIPWVSLCFIIFHMALTVIRNQKKVWVFSVHKIKNTLFNVLISLPLVMIFRWGWQGRVWGIVLAFVLSAVISIRFLRANGYLSLNYSKEITRDTLNVIIPMIPNSFQSVVISQVGILFMEYHFGKSLLGLYTVGYQIAFAIHMLFTTIALSWSPFLYEQLSRKSGIDKVHLTRMLYFVSGLLAAGVGFLFIFGASILRLFTTKSYAGSEPFILWFAVGFFFHGLYIFLLPILMKHEKQKAVSRISFLNMVLMIALNLILVRLVGPMGIAMAFALTYFSMFLGIAGLSLKVFPLPLFRALKIWS